MSICKNFVWILMSVSFSQIAFAGGFDITQLLALLESAQKRVIRISQNSQCNQEQLQHAVRVEFAGVIHVLEEAHSHPEIQAEQKKSVMKQTLESVCKSSFYLGESKFHFIQDPKKIDEALRLFFKVFHFYREEALKDTSMNLRCLADLISKTIQKDVDHFGLLYIQLGGLELTRELFHNAAYERARIYPVAKLPDPDFPSPIMQSVWGEKINEIVKIPGGKLDFETPLHLYHNGGFDLSKILRSFKNASTQTRQQFIADVKKTHLLEGLLDYGLLPSPINGYVSLCADVMTSVAEIIELSPKDFKDEVMKIDPHTGKSLLQLARENTQIEEMPWIKLTDKKRDQTYHEAFKKIADAYADEKKT